MESKGKEGGGSLVSAIDGREVEEDDGERAAEFL